MNFLITEVYDNKKAFELLKNWLYAVCYQKSEERPPRRNQWGYIIDDSNKRPKMFVKR